MPFESMSLKKNVNDLFPPPPHPPRLPPLKTDPSDNQKIGRFSTIIDVVELETKLGGTQIKAIKYSLNNLHSMESLNSIPRPCIKFFRNKALPITSKLMNRES